MEFLVMFVIFFFAYFALGKLHRYSNRVAFMFALIMSVAISAMTAIALITIP